MLKKGIVFILLTSVLVSCSFLQEVGKQTVEALNIRNCSFNLDGLESINIGGVNVKNIKSLTLSDIFKLTSCLAAKQLPVNLGINVGATNPSEKDASISKMLWACTIDDADLAQGSTTESFKIPAQGSTIIPISVNADAFNIFSSTGIDAVRSFIATLTDDNTITNRLAVKVKPTIQMGASTVTLPYISLAHN